MGLYGGLGRGLFRAGRATSKSAGASAAVSVDRVRQRRATRLAATGVLAPGDPSPPPSVQDYLDYRGVAKAREVRPLWHGEFPLGRFIDARRGLGEEIGLPPEILQRHAAVVGPTGGGKTKSIIVPWIAAALRQGACVVAIDVTGDLLDDLATHRQATGPLNAAVAKWDYTDPSHSVGWDWIGSLTDDDAVVSAVEALNGKQALNDSQPFFHQRDARFLRGLLELARDTSPGVTGRDLLRLLRTQQLLEQVLQQYAAHPGAQRLIDLAGRTSDEYAQATSGVVNALEVWDHPGLEAVTRSDELNLDTLFDQPSLLVVGAPIRGTRTSEAVSGLLMSQIIHRLYQRFTAPDPRPVFLVLDEAARLVNRLPIEELLSVGRRAKTSVLLATQDVSQFRDDNERHAIFSNCATYISLPGRSTRNADFLSERLGSRQQAITSMSYSPGAPAGMRQTRSVQRETLPVLGAREISGPPWGERTAVVHCPALVPKPFLVDLTRPEF